MKKPLNKYDLILYIENSKDHTHTVSHTHIHTHTYTHTQTNRTNKFSRVAGYNVNTQKSAVFLCTNNK